MQAVQAGCWLLAAGCWLLAVPMAVDGTHDGSQDGTYTGSQDDSYDGSATDPVECAKLRNRREKRNKGGVGGCWLLADLKIQGLPPVLMRSAKSRPGRERVG